MNNELFGVLAAIVCMVSFGLLNVITKIPAQAIGAMQTTVYRGLIIVPLLIIVLVVTWEQHSFNLAYIALAAAIATVSYFGLYFMTKGLTVGKVGIIVPLSSARVLLTSLVAVAFLGDVLSTGQVMAVIIIFLGVVLVSLDLADLRNFDFKTQGLAVRYGLLAAIFWGITFALFSIPIAKLGAYLFTLIVEVCVLVTAYVQMRLAREHLTAYKVITNEAKKYILPMGILGTLGTLFLNIGYDLGSVSIVTAISSANPIISIIYSRVFFHEKLSWQQYLAIGLIMLGVISLPLL